MKIKNIKQLKEQVGQIMSTDNGKVSDVLPQVGTMVQDYFDGRHERLIDSGITTDTANVLFGLKQDLDSYESSLLRGYLTDDTPLKKIADQIQEINQLDKQGYDIWDVSEDVDNAFVIDRDYVMDVIDYQSCYLNFIDKCHREYRAQK